MSLPRINNRMPVTLERAWFPFLLLTLVSVAYSPVAVDGFRKFLTYVSYMAMFILPFALVKTRRAAISGFSVAPLSCHPWDRFYTGCFSWGQRHDWYQGSRIESTFMHPNIFAFYLLTTIGTILSLLCHQSRPSDAAARGPSC